MSDDNVKYYALTDEQREALVTMNEVFTNFVNSHYSGLLNAKKALLEAPADVVPDQRAMAYMVDVELTVNKEDVPTYVDLDFVVDAHHASAADVHEALHADGYDPERNGSVNVNYITSGLDDMFEVEVDADLIFYINAVDIVLPSDVEIRDTKVVVPYLIDAIHAKHPQLEHLDFNIADYNAVSNGRVALPEQDDLAVGDELAAE